MTLFSGECLNLGLGVDIRKAVGWLWIKSIYSVRYLSLKSVSIIGSGSKNGTRLVSGDGPINIGLSIPISYALNLCHPHLVSL